MRLIYSAIKGEFAQAFAAMQKPIAKAATGAIKDTANQVKTEGRAAIAAAGFGRKWQNALRADVFPTSGASVNAATFIHHNIVYAGIFERGAEIAGKPLLWIPISGTPARIGGQRFTPKSYRNAIGPLVPLYRPGKAPLLLGYIQGGKRAIGKITVRKLARGQSTRAQLVPLFVGIKSVSIKPKFGLAAVFERARANLGQAYLDNLNPDDRS